MNKDKKLCLITLGCSKNLVDSELILGSIKNSQYTITEQPNEADTIIVNTCGFLDSAREESVDVILEAGELKKKGNLKQLVVSGCFSERYKNQIQDELPEVDHFFGTTDLDDLVKKVTGKDYQKNDPDFNRSILTPNHYAYLKIAEGCDNGCSFCSIPLMRGLQKSRSIEENVNEASKLVDQGVKEILVIAQDSTSYGWDLDRDTNLHKLFDKLDLIKDLNWIRLHYAHPAHLHRHMIERFRTLNKLLPYIDMPVQHGSDKMLKLMRRGMKTDGIKRKIDKLRNINPDICIRTSIIVGHPGETDEEFQKLYDFVEEVKFDRLGVFTYSNEEGTYGYDSFNDNIPQQVKYDRMDAIMLLQQDINLEKNNLLIGSKEKVIIDKLLNENESLGRTYRDSPDVDNNVVVKGHHKIGSIINATIVGASDYELEAEIIK